MGLRKLHDEISTTEIFRSEYAKCFIESMREEGIAGMTGMASPSATTEKDAKVLGVWKYMRVLEIIYKLVAQDTQDAYKKGVEDGKSSVA